MLATLGHGGALSLLSLFHQVKVPFASYFPGERAAESLLLPSSSSSAPRIAAGPPQSACLCVSCPKEEGEVSSPVMSPASQKAEWKKNVLFESYIQSQHEVAAPRKQKMHLF